MYPRGVMRLRKKELQENWRQETPDVRQGMKSEKKKSAGLVMIEM